MAISSGSILDGVNPLSESISLFLLQLAIIICLSRLLGYFLKFINQPSVIAEVVGGIILGPTVLSSIPAFKNTVFPKESLSKLKLVADVGLILYLFLVGMELDPVKVVKEFKKSASISLAGIAVPFSFGVGVSKVIYDTYIDDTVPFTSFFVFCGVAMSITAFPVLARILTERKLMGTTVGQATLAAAASDDAIAWCLLVLVVALIHNPERAINALFVFLITLGYALFLWFAIRPLFQKLVSESKHDHGDSQTNVFIVFITMILSAWYGLILSRFTQAIGVHAIFGAFLTGLMVPHERGFAIAITEKIEDLISILFLPLYFAYSGLNTRLSELSDGQTWGFVFLVILVACGGKIIGCTLAARYAHMTWRESVTVGLLMNTKGLVEIIVLNLGLEANLITDKVFAIFLIMALTTTFMTVPCVSWVYPMTMYQHNDYGEEEEEEDGKTIMVRNSSQRSIKDTFRIVVCLPSMRTVPAIMNLNHMLFSSGRKIDMYCLRLLELGDRMSQIMMASDSVNTMNSDPIIGILRTFSTLHKVSIKTLLTVSVQSQFYDDILEASHDLDSHLVLLPVKAAPQTFPKGWGAQCIEKCWEGATSPVGLFVDRGFGTKNSFEQTALSIPKPHQRIVFLFFGTRDDLEAITLFQHLAHTNEMSFSVLIHVPHSNHPTSFQEMLNSFPHVQVTEINHTSNDLMNRLLDLESKDLILLGHETYEEDQKSVTGFRFWLDHACKASFIVVKKPVEMAMDTTAVGGKIRMNRLQSQNRPASIL